MRSDVKLSDVCVTLYTGIEIDHRAPRSEISLPIGGLIIPSHCIYTEYCCLKSSYLPNSWNCPTMRICVPPHAAAPWPAEAAAYPTLNAALTALKLSTTARAITTLNATLGAANPQASTSAVTLFAPSEAAWAKFLANNTLGLTTVAALLANTAVLDQVMRYHMLFDCEAGPAPLPLVRDGAKDGGLRPGWVGRWGTGVG